MIDQAITAWPFVIAGLAILVHLCQVWFMRGQRFILKWSIAPFVILSAVLVTLSANYAIRHDTIPAYISSTTLEIFCMIHTIFIEYVAAIWPIVKAFSNTPRDVIFKNVSIRQVMVCGVAAQVVLVTVGTVTFVKTGLEFVWGMPIISHWIFFGLLLLIGRCGKRYRSDAWRVWTIFTGCIAFFSSVLLGVGLIYKDKVPVYPTQSLSTLATAVGGVIRHWGIHRHGESTPVGKAGGSRSTGHHNSQDSCTELNLVESASSGSRAIVPPTDSEIRGTCLQDTSTIDDSASDGSSFTDAPSEIPSLVILGRQYPLSPFSCFPIDTKAIMALYLAHRVFLDLDLGRLCRTEFGEVGPRDVLDVGTGTGIWAIDFADRFTKSNVKATDLAPFQRRWVPRNACFYVEDANDWGWGEREFDFIHCRGVDGGVKDWPGLFANMFRSLRAGGQVEVRNFSLWPTCDDGSNAPDNAWSKFPEMARSLENSGFDFGITKDGQCKRGLESAGFETVQEDRRLLGLKDREELLEIIVEMVMGIYIRTLGSDPAVSEEQAREFEDGLRSSGHVHIELVTVVGRKPDIAGADF